MNSIWKNDLLSREFDENGYVIIDFLDSSSVAKLKNIYDNSLLPVGNTFYSSSFIEDKQNKKSISIDLESVIDINTEKYFKDHKKLGAVFLVKPSGPNTEMPIHQDWTVVDENQYDSITIWIPLQDTTSHNGAIKVLPRSHKLSTAFRSPTLEDPLNKIKELAEKMMIPLPMKAGQAFIFSHSLLHSSFPNSSGAQRIAVAYGLLHINAELIYYFREQKGKPLEKLKVSEDFFLNYPAPGKRPENSVLIETVNYDEAIISESQFKQFYGIESHQELKKSSWARFKESIKNRFQH